MITQSLVEKPGIILSRQIKQEIATEVVEIIASGGKRPHLAAILVGHEGGSETYVASKVKACAECGFKSSLIRYETDVTEEELLAKVFAKLIFMENCPLNCENSVSIRFRFRRFDLFNSTGTSWFLRAGTLSLI
ncbi:Bifunctional protein FolD protein [termite gut metagenome]|uniref:Bifunctional protein FolD protein n=1 Tax=termite gut metagenome TaxID=433724 RepID=A0A5J4SVF9_9ZZZZ